MNLRVDFPVTLFIEFTDDGGSLRDDLLALLADYPVVAIHETDSDELSQWAVSFDETGWTPYEDVDVNAPSPAFERVSAPLGINWRRYPDLAELAASIAGKDIVSRFGPRVRCEFEANRDHWSVTTFEESFRRVQVGRIVVAPPWIFPNIDDSTIIVTIKPSNGFGTGHHPSTRLALALLQQIDCTGREVLDVGTGSGILAFAAAKLGAARVCAVDRDVDALAAAADGRGRNGFAAKRVELRQADISIDVLGEFDLVLVNLEAAQIHAWKDAILRHVRPGGHLLLSGFLDAERDVVMRGLSPSTLVVEREEAWAAMLLTQPSNR